MLASMGGGQGMMGPASQLMQQHTFTGAMLGPSEIQHSPSFMQSQDQGSNGPQGSSYIDEAAQQNSSEANQLEQSEQEKFEILKKNGLGYLLDEHPQDREINNLHKDFKNRFGAKSFSLNSTDNIFIKEENHKAKKNLDNIVSLKWILRLFFLLIVCINIFTFFFVPYQDFPILHNQSYRIYQSKKTLLTILETYSTALSVILVNENKFDGEMISKTFYKSKEIYLQKQKSNLLEYKDYFRVLNTDEDL